MRHMKRFNRTTTGPEKSPAGSRYSGHQATVRTWMWATIVGLLGALGPTACTENPPVFMCTLNADCIHNGVEGLCELNQACSFPDPSCLSGRAYGLYAPLELAQTCVLSEAGGSSSDTNDTLETTREG